MGGQWPGPDSFRVLLRVLSVPEGNGREQCVVNCAFLRLNVTDERNRIRSNKRVWRIVKQCRRLSVSAIIQKRRALHYCEQRVDDKDIEYEWQTTDK